MSLDIFFDDRCRTSRYYDPRRFYRYFWEDAYFEEKVGMLKTHFGNLYKFTEDEKSIIAYKSTDFYSMSIYNRSIFYEVGKEYESRCDYDLYNESSYGLSAWSYDEAKKFAYYSKDGYKIFKVQIDINDIGAILPNCRGKIRCKKLKILEELESNKLNNSKNRFLYL